MIEGRYFQPEMARSEPAKLWGERDDLRLVIGDDQTVHRPVLASVSDKLGNVPRKLTFVDGSVFEVAAGADIDQVMKQSTNTFAQRRTRTEGTVTSVQSNQLDALKFGTEQFIADDDFVTRLNSGRSLRVKLGIDPTASDIHLGFAVVLNKLRQFQDRGHTAVLILGDFTALVGDPSGRSKTRPRLSVDEVNANAMTYVDQITDILDPAQLEVRRNSEWFGPMGMDGVLDLTSRYTVARMLERDDFANRYRSGTPISVSEFLYPLMQGWDSVMVEADVELGGTDQLFNLLVGRDLQRQMSQPAQAIVTMPLLEGLDGVHAIAGDTDGVDGAEEVAGAVIGPELLERARSLGISAAARLDDNDGHGFFEALGAQVITGPTLTNVNDFRAILID